MTNEIKNLAPISKRILGALIDFCLFLLISIIPIYLATQWFWISTKDIQLDELTEHTKTINKSIGVTCGVIIDFLYSTLLIGRKRHQTWGQQIVGIKLVKIDGKEFGYLTSALRHVVSLFSSILLKIGFFIALVTKNKQTLHDLASGLVVVTVDNEISINKNPTQNKTLILDNESHIWADVAKEFNENRNEGLWAKCFAESGGDENKAKAIYLNLRFNELKNTQNIETFTTQPLKANSKTSYIKSVDKNNFIMGLIFLVVIAVVLIGVSAWMNSGTTNKDLATIENSITKNQYKDSNTNQWVFLVKEKKIKSNPASLFFYEKTSIVKNIDSTYRVLLAEVFENEPNGVTVQFPNNTTHNVFYLQKLYEYDCSLLKERSLGVEFYGSKFNDSQQIKLYSDFKVPQEPSFINSKTASKLCPILKSNFKWVFVSSSMADGSKVDNFYDENNVKKISTSNFLVDIASVFETPVYVAGFDGRESIPNVKYAKRLMEFNCNEFKVKKIKSDLYSSSLLDSNQVKINISSKIDNGIFETSKLSKDLCPMLSK
jgi:uncharacterized RDD family membrane protein YckC